MKHIIICLAAFIFAAVGREAFAGGADYNLAIREIKLARTYSAAGDADNAIKYLMKSKNTLAKYPGNFSTKYWTATTDEELFYVYCDIGDYEKAGKSINSAADIFEKIIRQKDGSPLPISIIRENFNKGIMPLSRNNAAVERNEILTADGWKPTNDNSVRSNADRKNSDIKGSKGTYSYKPNRKSKIQAGYEDNDYSWNTGENVLNFDRQKEIASNGLQIPDDASNLSFNSCRLDAIPRELYSLKKLTQLSLSDNKIETADLSGFTSAAKLEWLDLSNNRLTEFNGDFAKMKNLEYLDLSGNTRLKTLPAGMEKLKSLKVLNLSNCNLPFETISNLVRKLPDTQVIFDQYEKVNEDEEDEGGW